MFGSVKMPAIDLRYIAWVLGLFLIIVLTAIVTVSMTEKKVNPRVLTGIELLRASEAFVAIENADNFAESDPSQFDTLVSLAEARLGAFKATAQSHEALAESIVLTDLLNEIKTLPIVTSELGEAKKATAGTADDISYLRAWHRRELTLGIIDTCRNEAETYIYPEYHVPFDGCHYRVNATRLARR